MEIGDDGSLWRRLVSTRCGRRNWCYRARSSSIGFAAWLDERKAISRRDHVGSGLVANTSASRRLAWLRS